MGKVRIGVDVGGITNRTVLLTAANSVAFEDCLDTDATCSPLFLLPLDPVRPMAEQSPPIRTLISGRSGNAPEGVFQLRT